jgi:hypothetical protein
MHTIGLVVLAALAWQCEPIHVGFGPEDFEVDPSHPSRIIVASKDPYFVDITPAGLARPRKIEVQGLPHELEMVGIFAVRSADGVARLYAINRRHAGIEVFRIAENALAWETSIPLPNGWHKRANEVLALPNGHVYVSLAQGRGGLLQYWENLTKRKWAKVLLHRDGAWHEAATGLAFANGLQISEDEKTLYVSAFDERKIYAYPRNADGSLDEANRRALRVSGSPDNLKWHEGRLLVAAHPSKLRTALYFVHLAKPRSLVYAIDPRTGVEEAIYDGRDIAAASTAHREGELLFMSQIKRDWIVSCRRR